MTPYTVQIQRLDSVPLAVIRRQVSASRLGRVVPECCGLVWDAVRAQQAQAGRHVVPIGMAAFGSRWGWSFMDRLPSTARSVTSSETECRVSSAPI